MTQLGISHYLCRGEQKREGEGKGEKEVGSRLFQIGWGGGGGLNFLCRSLEGGLQFKVHFKSGVLLKVSVKHRVINLWLSMA